MSHAQRSKLDDIMNALKTSCTEAELREIYEDFFPPPTKFERIQRIIAEGDSVQLDELWHSLCGGFSASDEHDWVVRGR